MADRGNWDAECGRWHETAVKKLKQTGRCPFRVRVYMGPGQPLDWTDPDGLTDEGRVKLRLLNRGFAAVPPAAVLLSSDTWQAGDEFFRHHGIDHLPYKERMERYSAILAERYKGSLGEVPDALKGEAVITIVKGPGFMEAHRMTHYRREANDRIVTVKPAFDDGMVALNLVPNWWKSVVQ